MAYELATNVEERWRQRSRCNWLALGDRNTRFFHAMASSRLRNNMVFSIVEEGRTITDQQEIIDKFSKTMQDLLGSSSQVPSFNPAALYPINPDLNSLQQPFTLEEVKSAVQQLANNKASGPDDLPNEFIKVYWQELQGEIMQIFGSFYNNTLDLRFYNVANIVMVPKMESPASTSDFRPISVQIDIQGPFEPAETSTARTHISFSNGVCAW